MKVHLLEDNPHELMISTANKSTLDLLKNCLDGKKVFKKNQIVIPVKATANLPSFKGIEPIDFETEEAKNTVNKIMLDVYNNFLVIANIKNGDIIFDYDYKGPYEGFMQHQKVMYNVMTRSDFGAILGDPGTGKTLAFLAAIDERIKKGEVTRALIITLSGLKKNIEAEAAIQIPHRDCIVYRSKKHADQVINKRFSRENKNKDYHIHITNYEAMSASGELIKDGYFDMIILDEAHRVGSPRSSQTREILKRFENAKYKYIATGTLNANNVMSFYMPYRFMGADVVPYSNYYAYRSQHMRTVDPDRHIWVPKQGALSETAKVIGRSAVQYKKEDCMDLPDLVFIRLSTEMHGAQKYAYRDAKEDMVLKLDKLCEGCEHTETCTRDVCINDKAIIDTALVLLRKLHQIAAGFYIASTTTVDDDGNETVEQEIIEFDDNPKLKLLLETVENIPSSEKIIIWASYTYSIEKIKSKLVSIYGESSVVTGYGTQDAFTQVEKFREHHARFLVANTKKMSTGLNIQFSSYQIFYDNTFSLIDREQAIGRQHRKGQDNKVTVYDLVTTNTVDEYILETLIGKQDLAVTLSQFAKVLQ